jgi:hypothetical protein
VALLVEASALTAPPFSVGPGSDIVADSVRKATVEVPRFSARADVRSTGGTSETRLAEAVVPVSGSGARICA